MSQEPIYTAHPIDDDRAMHPLEEVLRLIGRSAPRPFFPAEFIARSRANPDQLSAILDHLALEGLIDKVPARSLESGTGIVLTPLGEKVLSDPALVARLVRGDALREGDVGAVIRKGMRTRVRPTFTYVLIAVNVGIYLLGMANEAWSPGSPIRPMGAEFSKWAGNANAISAGEWWRLITCTFLHGSLMHVGCNMFSLWSLGAFVEQAWGRWRFLLIYFVAGWAGSCLGVQYAGSLVGASGAICGLLAAVGAWFVLYRKHIPGDFARQGLWQVAVSVGLITLIGVMVPYVSNAGHIGGGIGGLAAALVLHVQRFGLPGMSRKAAMLRWALAVPLLLLLPVASYLQMKSGRADRGVGKNDEKPGKELVKKGEKLDPVEGAAFHRDFGDGFRTDVFQAHDNLSRMPDLSNEAKVKRKRTQIKEYRDKLVELRARLEKASYDNEPVERMRKEGLAFVDRMLAISDLADEYLRGPADASSQKLDARYDAFVDPFNDYLEKLKRLAPKEKGGD